MDRGTFVLACEMVMDADCVLAAEDSAVYVIRCNLGFAFSGVNLHGLLIVRGFRGRLNSDPTHKFTSRTKVPVGATNQPKHRTYTVKIRFFYFEYFLMYCL